MVEAEQQCCSVPGALSAIFILEGAETHPPRPHPLTVASLPQQSMALSVLFLAARASTQQPDKRHTSEARLTIRSRVNGLGSALCRTLPDLLGLVGAGLQT
jgi:hypothetical protein